MTYSAGSISNDIYNLIPNLPTSLSGTNLFPVINRAVFQANNYMGTSISGASIDDTYIPIIYNLTAAETLQLLHLQGIQSASTSVGDFSEAKNANSPLILASEAYTKKAYDDMNILGRKQVFYKSLG